MYVIEQKNIKLKVNIFKNLLMNLKNVYEKNTLLKNLIFLT